MVKRYDFYDGERYEYDDGEYLAYDDYEKLEKQLAELREKLRWIPGTERLPENNGDYELKNNGHLFVVFDNGKWYYQDSNGWKEYLILGIESWREIPELEDGE